MNIYTGKYEWNTISDFERIRPPQWMVDLWALRNYTGTTHFKYSFKNKILYSIFSFIIKMHTQQRLSFLASTGIQHLLLSSFLCFYHFDKFLGREKDVTYTEKLSEFADISSVWYTYVKHPNWGKSILKKLIFF